MLTELRGNQQLDTSPDQRFCSDPDSNDLLLPASDSIMLKFIKKAAFPVSIMTLLKKKNIFLHLMREDLTLPFSIHVTSGQSTSPRNHNSYTTRCEDRTMFATSLGICETRLSSTSTIWYEFHSNGPCLSATSSSE